MARAEARNLRPSTIPGLRSWASLAAACTALVLLSGGLVFFGTPKPMSSTPPATAGPNPSLGTSGGMWPQTSLTEVQAAQALADRGDPSTVWQRLVDELQLAQHHPCSGASVGCLGREAGAFFARFLEQDLGWAAYAWNEAFGHRAGLDDGDLIFVRCAPGKPNTLFPSDAYGGSCAPTIDDRRYETVKVHVAQPGLQGPRGIWVVTGWELVEPAAQADARAIEVEADALVQAFVDARIRGAGADRFATFPLDTPNIDDVADPGIPLLYATESGARYERSAFDVVAGPRWPDGYIEYRIRMSAADGATTVEQQFSVDPRAPRPWKLVYDFKEASSDGPGTTQDGHAVPLAYQFLDGLATYQVAYPLGPSHGGFYAPNQLAVDGLLPEDAFPRRILTLLTDPTPSALRCTAAAPVDAEVLARSLQDDPTFRGPPTKSITIAGHRALEIEGAVATGLPCGNFVETVDTTRSGARLYLIDLPAGPARVLAISIVADLDSFPGVLEAALTVIDSIEVHAP